MIWCFLFLPFLTRKLDLLNCMTVYSVNEAQLGMFKLSINVNYTLIVKIKNIPINAISQYISHKSHYAPPFR